jgi:hypothetical protein
VRNFVIEEKIVVEMDAQIFSGALGGTEPWKTLR